MKKTFDSIFFLFLFFFVVALCSCHSKKNSQSSSAQIKIATLSYSPASPDTNCELSPCREIQSLTREGLFRWQYLEHQLTLKPTMAESWSYLDKRTLEIRLKKNLKASDGTPILAQDFTEAWKRSLASKDRRKAHLLFPIVNARSFFEGFSTFSEVGIKSTDPTTLLISLSKPSPHFILTLAHPTTWLEPRPIKNPTRFYGPFIPIQSTSSNSVHLLKNPLATWNQAKVDEIELVDIFDKQMGFNLLEDKEINLILNPGEHTHETRGGEAVASLNRAVLNFNYKNTLLENQNFRKSLIYAINKSEWKTVLQLSLLPISTLAPYYEGSYQSQDLYSPEKSKSFFQEFVKRRVNNFNVAPDSFRPLKLIYPPELEAIAINLKYQWMKELNLKIILSPESINKGNAKDLQSEWDISISVISISPFNYSQSIHRMGYRLNTLGATEIAKELTTLFSPLQTSQLDTPEEIYKLFSQIESTAVEDQALYLPLFSYTHTAKHSPTLKGLVANPMGGIDLSQIEPSS